jgi:hypothetical protein
MLDTSIPATYIEQLISTNEQQHQVAKIVTHPHTLPFFLLKGLKRISLISLVFFVG